LESVPRRVQEYKLLREQKYKLIRKLKKGEKLWKVGYYGIPIEQDEGDGGNPRG
jgi:hypothetical protein